MNFILIYDCYHACRVLCYQHLSLVLPEGLLFFTFWPSCPPVFLEDHQKVKKQFNSASSAFSSEAGGENN